LTAHRAAVDRAGGIGRNNVRLPVLRLLRLRCVLAVRKIDKIVPCLLTQALVQLRQQSDIAFSAAVIGLDGIEIGVSRDQKRLPRACILHTAQQRSDRQHGAERDFQELFSAHRRHPPLFQIDLAALDAPPAEFFLPIADKGRAAHPCEDKAQEHQLKETQTDGLEAVAEREREVRRVDAREEGGERQDPAEDGVDKEEEQHERHVDEVAPPCEHHREHAEDLDKRREQLIDEEIEIGYKAHRANL